MSVAVTKTLIPHKYFRDGDKLNNKPEWKYCKYEKHKQMGAMAK